MRWFLPFLLALPISLFGANGDITGVAIETNGWQALVYVSGLGTNGTFSLGLGANNALTGTESLKLSLTSAGFDDTGATTTVSRVIYGTKQVRFPYPGDAFPDTTLPGDGTVKLRIALSDYIFSDDSVATASLLTNLYSQGGTGSSPATWASVTNLSTYTPAKPIGNWTWPGWNVVNGNTMRLRAKSAHLSARLGRPVRVMKFLAADQHSHAVTNYVTQMTIDPTVAGAVPTADYIADMDISTFTDKDLIRCDFTAYPWVGTNFLTTTDGVNANAPLYAPQTNVCNRGGTYGGAVAVASASGNDATGVAFTQAQWATNTAPAEFATIGGAFLAAKGTNSTAYGHNDSGGSTVYLKAGSYQIPSAVATAGGFGWSIVTHYPTNTASDCVITNCAGNLTSRIKLDSIRIEVASTLNYWSSIQAWFDNCAITSPGSAFQYGTIPWFVTRCNVAQLPQGLMPNSGTKAAPVCISRGNILKVSSMLYVFCGNVETNYNLVYGNADSSTGACPTQDGLIITDNMFLNKSATTAPVGIFGDVTTLSGNLFAGNLLECSTNSSNPLLTAFGDGTTNNAGENNVLFWNNTVVGQRVNMGYDDRGSTPHWKIGWSVNGNVMDDYNIKSDTFTGIAADGARIGNWSSLYGVAYNSNSYSEISNIGAGFPNDFDGLYSKFNSPKVAASWPGYVNRASYDGVSNGPGLGNYRVLSSSPLLQYASVLVWPFDFEGNHRGLSDPPGAYASASPRKGAGFFAP